MVRKSNKSGEVNHVNTLEKDLNFWLVWHKTIDIEEDSMKFTNKSIANFSKKTWNGENLQVLSERNETEFSPKFDHRLKNFPHTTVAIGICGLGRSIILYCETERLFFSWATNKHMHTKANYNQRSQRNTKLSFCSL